MACVVDYGDCGTLVDSGRGMKLALKSKTEITNQLTQELEELVSNPKLINNLAENAYKHVMKYYSWSQKAKEHYKCIIECYTARGQDCGFLKPAALYYSWFPLILFSANVAARRIGRSEKPYFWNK